MTLEKVCPNFQTCFFVRYLKRPEIWEMITYLFCHSDYTACKRFQRKKLEGKVPRDLWPVESISISEILQNLDFDFNKLLSQYKIYFSKFAESDEYRELFNDGIFLKFKEKLGAQVEIFLTFFKRYYQDLFIKEFDQSFFIEMAYLYESQKIEDSVFDSLFLLFISRLEENFIKWLHTQQISEEERSYAIFTFGKINALAGLFFKKAVKLIQEVKYLYISKKQFEKLQDEIYTDGLTGALNRKFLEVFEEKLRNTYNFVLVLDLDHFKRINDTYGHQAGDAVLKGIVKLLKTILRQNDLVIRYGGEEFVVLINNRSVEHALIVAEKLRKAVENHTFEYEGIPIKATLSIGVSSIDKNVPLQESFKKADKALYLAKEKGRNRVEVYNKEETTSIK